MNSLAVSELLTIDVDSEIRKLCSRQLAGEAERLIELVRLAVRLGAHRVALAIGRGRATITAPGAILPSQALATLAALADVSRPADERHRALVALEGSLGAAFVSLVSAPRATIEAGGRELELGKKNTLRLSTHTGGGHELRLDLSRQGAAAEERRTLAAACLYSRIPVTVNGRTVSRGLELTDCLITTRVVTEELEILVGLPRRGQLSRTTVLVNDVVAQDRYWLSRRGRVHTAVVRVLGASAGARPDSRRVDELTRRGALALYEELRRGFDALPAGSRAVAWQLLLRRAVGEGDPDLLRGVRMFRRLTGGPIDVGTLTQLASRGALWSVEPGATPRRLLVHPSTVLVLDALERGLLADRLGIAPSQPPTATRDALTTRAWARVREAGRRCVRLWRAGAGRVVSARAVPRSAWTAGEGRLVEALTAEIGAGRFVLPGLSAGVSRRVVVQLVERGSLPLRTRRRGDHLELCLPRRDTRVQRMVQVFASDPASLRPILAALFAGHDGGA